MDELTNGRRNTAGTNAVNYRTLDCQSCITNGGRQCLLDGEWTYAVCCSPDPAEASYFCRTQQELVYCASEDTITNEVLQDFVCPAERARCPSMQSEIEIKLDEADLTAVREYRWDDTQSLPAQEAADWHCKYQVTAGPELASDQGKGGHIVIDVEMEGFDNYVYLILQAHNQFNDIQDEQPVPGASDTDEAEVQRYYPAKHGSRFIVPGEQDALIAFAPVSNNDGTQGTSQGGRISIKAVYRHSLSAVEWNGEDVQYVPRPGEAEEEPPAPAASIIEDLETA